MSVTLADVVWERGGAPEDMVRSLPGFALAGITAGLARRCEQGIARDPVPNNPAHAVVFGEKPKSVRKTLAVQAEWIIPPPDCLSA